MASPRHRSRSTSSPSASVAVINGWQIFTHPLFLAQFEALLGDVERLRAKDPSGYSANKKSKLLAAIYRMAFEIIPQNPADPSFRQGNTLGAAHRHWCRGKFFAGRYRLFFRYSQAEKIIVLAWVNDEDTIRTYGNKTDAYATFKKMLAGDTPPDAWDKLLSEAKAASASAARIVGKLQEK